LFVPGKLETVYTDLDCPIVGGALPSAELPLPAYGELASSFFTERRELGIINIGDPGEIHVGAHLHACATRLSLHRNR